MTDPVPDASAQPATPPAATPPAATPPPAAYRRPEGTIEDARSPWTTSLVLLVAVGALGLWVYFGEGSVPPPPSEVAVELFPRATSYELYPLQVVGLEIERGEERLTFSREPTAEELAGQATKTEEGHNAPVGWMLSEPVQDRGDDTQIFRLLNRIQHARRELKLEDASTFGPTTLVVRLDRKQGFDDVTLTFGTPIGGQVGVTVEVVQRPTRYFRIKADLHQELSRPSWVWRRKVLFEAPLAEVKAVHAKVRTDEGVRSLGVARGARVWRVDSPSGDLADRGKAEELVEAVRLLRAATIHSDQASPELLESLGLERPWATLSMTQADEGEAGGQSTARLRLGDPVPERSTERYALLESRPEVVFTVQTGVFETALRRDHDLYYSPRLFMVEGGADAVTGIGAEVTTLAPLPPVRWRVERKEEGWRFAEGASKPIAAKSAVDAMITTLLGLRIGERLSGPEQTPDLAALGLDAPTHRIELFEDDFRHVVEVGKPRERGGRAIRRLLPNPDPAGQPLAFVYLVKLGDLTKGLEEAELSLLSPQIYSASNWDAQRVELLESDGSVSARVSFSPADPAHPDGPKRWAPEAGGGSTFDEESFKSWLKLFDRFNVQRYVRRQKGADLKAYGLDSPRKLTIWVSGFEDGERVQTPKVLLIGKSEGESVYVMTPEGAAIGLVDERFLRMIYRGFDKGEVLWVADPYDVSVVRFHRQGLLALELLKSETKLWRWGVPEVRRQLPREARQELERTLLEDVLGRVVLHKSEPATPTRLAETGLDRAQWRIEVSTKPLGGEAPQRHTLLIGGSAGGESRWAMQEGGETLGVYSGTRALESFVERARPPAPFPRPRR